ncbi:iron ABC transporter permease [Staphylococcus chromogenes]|nr:iron ABC transporter permease [Staphylococcus chromogenes]
MLAARNRLPLAAVLAVAVIALSLSTLLSVAIGAQKIPLADIGTALTHPDSSSNSTVASILWDRRIPRTLVALCAGMSLGVAGALAQALTRNPLVDTGVLGINSGAAFAIVCGLAVGLNDAPLTLFGLALLGALVTGCGVYVLSRSHAGAKGADPVRLVLAGVALSAILGGVGDGLALVNPQAFDRLHAWMVGSVDVGNFQPVWLAAGGLVVGLAVAAGAIRGLSALQLGDEMAASLGASLAKTRLLAFAGVVLLAASATAAAGVFVFLGLLVPHIARWLVGPSFGRLVLVSALLGPLVLVLADVLGRIIMPGEFPAGVVVSFIGAPFLVAYAQTRRTEI